MVQSKRVYRLSIIGGKRSRRSKIDLNEIVIMDAATDFDGQFTVLYGGAMEGDGEPLEACENCSQVTTHEHFNRDSRLQAIKQVLFLLLIFFNNQQPRGPRVTTRRLTGVTAHDLTSDDPGSSLLREAAKFIY
ncbi:hypothetical protein E3N88_22547 [Mikania micrantha]|uniref:Uncharacterized protein n=1 Tax=Mikania micrantha TaxID=192012 RepID=A0A5N6NAP5_9ASTR|nr:hypothetical protein E3N88_22547 [Mikania micrantha]